MHPVFYTPTPIPLLYFATVPKEKAKYWPRLTAGYSFYDDYQARTARDIAVIVLTPAAETVDA